MIITGILFGLFLAYANGANDNFKGVATLFGSGTTNYKGALLWATITTALGSITALFFAQELLHAFSGKGLISGDLLNNAAFPISIAFAAATTVMLATLLGFPISTTHSLIGALIGVGLFGSEMGINFERLESTFLLPLLISPIIAILVTIVLYKIAKSLSATFGIQKQTCICIGTEIVEVVTPGHDPQTVLRSVTAQLPNIVSGNEAVCRERFSGRVFGVSIDTIIDRLHYLSSGMVGFARGLNDTPKIAAILLAGSSISHSFAIFSVAAFMVLGGLISARKVAETMSHKITTMDHGQGLTANIVTSIVVIFASKIGVPVSTTHVSTGSIFGIASVSGTTQWGMAGKILAAWLITLPVSALLGSIILILK